MMEKENKLEEKFKSCRKLDFGCFMVFFLFLKLETCELGFT